ncbi:hypothetical protein [Alkaliphilus transvaalensis]|uniref:hypothetical protein n=1 Tax=Alkaliphilus transvaalensis TaxID=114628 RepID=UPI00047DF5B5|nr:hypothetical protein [Alkaliphilus transvaalensis]
MKKHYGILAILLILSMIVTTGCRPAGKSRRAIQREMKEYLEAEYNSPAHVKRPVLSGNTGFGYHSYSAEAYLKNDPDNKFYVSYHITDGRITAGYHTVRLRQEGRKSMYEKLTKYYNPDDILQMNFMIHYNSGLVRTEDMTYESLVEEHRGEYRIDLTFHIAKEHFNEELESEVIRRFLEDYSEKNNLEKIDLFIVYWNEAYKEEFHKTFKYNIPENPIERGLRFADFYLVVRHTTDFDINNISRYFNYED